MKILVLIGSLRAASLSRRLAEAAAARAPDGVAIEYTDGRDLPHYDQDLDGDEKPAPVQALQGQVREADALVFVSPEFNYGIPGSLKNAIDWASRPAFRSPLRGKPSLVITHSIAPTGGARAHVMLCTVLAGCVTPVYPVPSLAIGTSHEKFDAEGVLADELTATRLTKTMEGFVAWAERVRAD